MPQSILSRHNDLLDSGFLELTGFSKLEYGPVSLDNIADQLAVYALEFVEMAKNKLDLADRVASGDLSDSIVASRVSIFGKVYKVEISIKDYYKFVDQGVRGWQDENGGNSPYQFKKFGRSGAKSSKMVEAIKKWVISEGLKGVGKENAHPRAHKRDQRRAKMTDATTRTAIVISKSIRKKGLKPSYFWTETQKEMSDMVLSGLGKALKVDIINNIIPKNGNSNK